MITLEWIKFFIGSVIAFVLLMSVANLISGLLRTNVTAYEVLINHLIELPGNASKIFPISCLTGTLFCINKLQSRNELVAIFASGFSRMKFVFTIIILSLLASAVQIYLAGYVYPFAKSKKNVFIEQSESKFRNLKTKAITSSTIGTGKIWFKGSNYFFSFTHYDKSSKGLIDLGIYAYDKNFLLTDKTFTSKAIFETATGKWTSENSSLISGLNNHEHPRMTISGPGNVALAETPDDFIRLESDINSLNLHGLYHHLKNIRRSGINIDEYLVQFYDKINAAISCVLLSIFAAISIFRPNRRQSSFGRTIAFVFVFTLVFWLLISYFQELGNSSRLPPVYACFSVSFGFLIYLSFIYIKNRKLT
ncbi:MAG: LptF/LptG family permease [Bdellovibrio sp.]|nr:LptF/LptG family permease [Bdellovibrio sp.]